MFGKLIALCVLFIFAVSLNGCATVRKQSDLEIQGLKNQISVLEAEIQSKNQEISSLRDALSKIVEEKSELAKELHKKKAIGEVKSHPNIKQIQTALTNAGYNPGPIDGRMGRQTRVAIKAFQKANNLKEDGRVGKETWNLLKDYLEKKVK
jgi:peptidoglycan hydrolase-like protein with peptidoglycan-binding domain